MKAAEIKQKQSQLKESYRTDPNSAIKSLVAKGVVDLDGLACNIQQPTFFAPAGMHEAGGGNGSFACPVEIMLAGLVSCAGVTFAAVASAMHLDIKACTVSAIGTIDFCGTLAVNRDAPVELTKIQLDFRIDSPEDTEKIEKLLELTHRYCVVHRTLENPPEIQVTTSSI